MLTRRDWYIGVVLVMLAVLLHAMVPRYEWRAVADQPTRMIRVDRWSGRAAVGFFYQGTWRPVTR
jgi:hypothetical protein